jgi:hypothetical protein
VRNIVAKTEAVAVTNIFYNFIQPAQTSNILSVTPQSAMGPKAKKKGKGADDADGGDGSTAGPGVAGTDQSDWINLKNEADRLYKLTQKEEHDFNEFQQQREKLNYFWIVEKKTLDDKRAELRNKERELQDLEEKHQVEIKIYKQRLKHLLQEQQTEVTQRKIATETSLKMAQDDDRQSEIGLKDDRRVLNMTLKEMELAHEEFVRGLKREQDKKITFLRHEFERKANEVQRMFEARTKKSREVLDRQRRDEIKMIEESKHVMIEALMGEHQRAFSDIKNYYNDITHNNLDLIKSLKEEVKDLEAEERKDEMRLNEKLNENKKLSAPLKRMQEDVVRLRAELEEYKLEKAEMRKVKSSLQVVESENASLTWEYEVLQQRFLTLKAETDELRDQFSAAVFDIKQKSSFKSILLEKKIGAVRSVQEMREAQLSEALKLANLEPTVLGRPPEGMDAVMAVKNEESKRLQQEIVRVKALHEQLLRSVGEKLHEYGLTMDELGYTPAKLSANVH